MQRWFLLEKGSAVQMLFPQVSSLELLESLLAGTAHEDRWTMWGRGLVAGSLASVPSEVSFKSVYWRCSLVCGMGLLASMQLAGNLWAAVQMRVADGRADVGLLACMNTRHSHRCSK